MTETGQTDGVDEALARIDQRARATVRRMRWSLPVIAVIGGGASYSVNRFNPSRNHHQHHHHSTIGLIIGLAIGAVFVVGGGAVVWRFRRRGAGLFSYWTNPPLTAGLGRRDRRTVHRDIRRGTPNPDAVLRAVEEQTVERLRRLQPRWVLWAFPLVPAVMIVNALLPGRSEAGRIYYGVFAGLFVVMGLVAFWQRRAVDRFPRVAAG